MTALAGLACEQGAALASDCMFSVGSAFSEIEPNILKIHKGDNFAIGYTGHAKDGTNFLFDFEKSEIPENLSFKETEKYIVDRLHLASQKFTQETIISAEDATLGKVRGCDFIIVMKKGTFLVFENDTCKSFPAELNMLVSLFTFTSANEYDIWMDNIQQNDDISNSVKQRTHDAIVYICNNLRVPYCGINAQGPYVVSAE
jgi:hypothetical protein